MAASTLVPLQVYLEPDYRPDCDWIDGEVKERNSGEGQHSNIQVFFIGLFLQHKREWGIRVWPEQRVQVAANRFRVPDVTLTRAIDPFEAIITVAPLLCIEVMSSEQRMSEIEERAKDYLAMGVPMVWIVDPLRRTAFVSDANGHRQVPEELAVPGTEIRVTLQEVFAELDELEGGRGASSDQ
ncbi:Uma2 family endonuclease [Granulicella aggregans]|uniref:Uma2 family endonuclease n=1 Tax=Granulicella aggregans TaxID=474949 RepID=A0A7W8E5P5_9BACT|nr:Uma2 family endonuclease [Granulicella aggregans]MBB5059524.1 Uma2 family endonuclease [Granulicella aggregans]